jgi:hypothetical protein
MAKGAPAYFNPEQRLVTQGDLLNPVFWRQFFENLNDQANAVIDLQTDVTNFLLIANGGTSATTANLAFANLSPMVARGDLISRNALVPIRVPIGAAGTILSSDGVDPSWQAAASVIGGRFAPIMLLMGG